MTRQYGRYTKKIAKTIHMAWRKTVDSWDHGAYAVDCAAATKIQNYVETCGLCSLPPVVGRNVSNDESHCCVPTEICSECDPVPAMPLRKVKPKCDFGHSRRINAKKREGSCVHCERPIDAHEEAYHCFSCRTDTCVKCALVPFPHRPKRSGWVTTTQPMFRRRFPRD